MTRNKRWWQSEDIIRWRRRQQQQHRKGRSKNCVDVVTGDRGLAVLLLHPFVLRARRRCPVARQRNVRANLSTGVTVLSRRGEKRADVACVLIWLRVCSPIAVV